MNGYDQTMWEVINGLREDRAKIQQSLDGVVKELDRLSTTVEKSFDRMNEENGKQNLQIKEVQVDVDNLGERFRSHIDGHWRWATLIFTATTSIGAFLSKFWKNHQ